MRLVSTVSLGVTLQDSSRDTVCNLPSGLFFHGQDSPDAPEVSQQPCFPPNQLRVISVRFLQSCLLVGQFILQTYLLHSVYLVSVFPSSVMMAATVGGAKNRS